jgi:hypothetical protein
MDRIEELRTQAKQQYTALRQSLSSFEERVVADRWDEDTVVRSGFGYFLGSLDRFAGWVLADDEISRRGENLMRRTGHPANAGSEARGEITGGQTGREGEQRVSDEAEAPAPPPDDAAKVSSVAVTFTLPAEVRAGSVALCGEFNQWSTEAAQLERGVDGTWRTTVALEPGRSYRYRYLLDGERWENDPRADRYLPNPYGSTDSVVIVQPRHGS